MHRRWVALWKVRSRLRGRRPTSTIDPFGQPSSCDIEPSSPTPSSLGGSRGSGLWSPPHPQLGVILGGKSPFKNRPISAEFFRFFATCGATPRGGGGAPPTTLILLRNQFEQKR